MTFATLPFASLMQRRSRVLFSAFTLAISLATLTFTLSVTSRIRATLATFDKPRLAVVSAIEGRFPISHLATIARTLHLEHGIEHINIYGGEDGKGFNYWVWGQTDGYLVDFSPVLAYVDPADNARWLADRQGALVTDSVLDKMGWKIGDTVTVKSSIGAIQAHLVGKLRGSVEPTVTLHYAYTDDVAQPPVRGTVLNAFFPVPRAEFKATEAQVEALFATHETPLLAIPWLSLHSYFLRGAAALPDLIELVGFVMAIVAILIHSAALTTSLAERRAELATLRVIGFSRPRIASLIVLESVGTCLLGGILGCVLPWGVLHGRGFSFAIMGLSDVRISLPACAAGVALSIVAGVVAAVVPIVTTYRARLLDSLAAG